MVDVDASLEDALSELPDAVEEIEEVQEPRL